MKTLVITLAVAFVLSGCLGSSGDDATDTPAATTPTIATANGTATSATSPATATATTAAPTATRAAATATATEAVAPTDVVIDVRTPGALDSTPTTGTSTSDDAAIQQQLAGILSDTATIRGLSPKQDVPSQIISRDQLHQNLVAELEKDYSQQEADADALELWLLRLIPDQTIDLYQLQLDLLSEQVIGYYDPETAQLYIVSEQGLDPTAQYTASHEYTHALQDQYFDLKTLQDSEGTDSDRDLGLTSLIEGDAVLASSVYVFQYMDPADAAELASGAGEVGDTSVIDSAPPYIADSLLFPYDQGSTFVTQLYLNGEFDAVDDAFADPPSSTEQILHPEKFTSSARDEPQTVTLPDLAAALGAGWTQTDTDTLGEFDFQEMLSQNGASDPNGGADGWGGSQYDLLQNGDQSLVALSTVWDSNDEAAQFHAQLLTSLPGDPGADGLWTDGARFFGVAASGDGVVYIAGTDENAVKTALAALGAI